MIQNDLTSRDIADRIAQSERRSRRRMALITLIPAVGAILLLGVTSARLYQGYTRVRRLSDSRAVAIRNLGATIDRIQREKTQLQAAAQLCQSQYAEQSRVLDVLQKSSRGHGVSVQILSNAERAVVQAREVQDRITKTLRDTPQASVPRVFLHIASEDQREKARAVQDLLIAQGYNAPGIENVGRVIRRIQLANTQVRYFHRDDAAGAERIADLLRKNFDVRSAAPSFTRFDEPPARFEVWFSEDAFGAVPDNKSGA